MGSWIGRVVDDSSLNSAVIAIGNTLRINLFCDFAGGGGSYTGCTAQESDPVPFLWCMIKLGASPQLE